MKNIDFKNKGVKYMDMSKLFKKTEEKDFITFPSTLETYAWYKPILILIIAAILSFVISFAILSIMRVDAKGTGIISFIYTAITVILLIPSIFIGNKLIYKIPFSTQIAPIRKWNWGIYIKSLIITLIVYSVIGLYPMLTSGMEISNNLSITVLLLCIILPLFQGFAEEYLCRGLLMQSFGSWFKIPIVAIILQAAIFAIMHPYQIYALMGVLFIGIFYGLITWYGQGLEASSAMHAVNNIFSFLAIALNLQQGPGESNPTTFIMNLALVVIPTIIILVLDKFNLIGFEKPETD